MECGQEGVSYGGGITPSGAVMISNSTISVNSAQYFSPFGYGGTAPMDWVICLGPINGACRCTIRSRVEVATWKPTKIRAISAGSVAEV